MPESTPVSSIHSAADEKKPETRKPLSDKKLQELGDEVHGKIVGANKDAEGRPALAYKREPFDKSPLKAAIDKAKAGMSLDAKVLGVDEKKVEDVQKKVEDVQKKVEQEFDALSAAMLKRYEGLVATASPVPFQKKDWDAEVTKAGDEIKKHLAELKTAGGDASKVDTLITDTQKKLQEQVSKGLEDTLTAESKSLDRKKENNASDLAAEKLKDDLKYTAAPTSEKERKMLEQKREKDKSDQEKLFQLLRPIEKPDFFDDVLPAEALNDPLIGAKTDDPDMFIKQVQKRREHMQKNKDGQYVLTSPTAKDDHGKPVKFFVDSNGIRPYPPGEGAKNYAFAIDDLLFTTGTSVVKLNVPDLSGIRHEDAVRRIFDVVKIAHSKKDARGNQIEVDLGGIEFRLQQLHAELEEAHKSSFIHTTDPTQKVIEEFQAYMIHHREKKALEKDIGSSISETDKALSELGDKGQKRDAEAAKLETDVKNDSKGKELIAALTKPSAPEPSAPELSSVAAKADRQTVEKVTEEITKLVRQQKILESMGVPAEVKSNPAEPVARKVELDATTGRTKLDEAIATVEKEIKSTKDHTEKLSKKISELTAMIENKRESQPEILFGVAKADPGQSYIDKLEELQKQLSAESVSLVQKAKALQDAAKSLAPTASEAKTVIDARIAKIDGLVKDIDTTKKALDGGHKDSLDRVIINIEPVTKAVEKAARKGLTGVELAANVAATLQKSAPLRRP